MPWWTWILIWTALLALSLSLFVLLGVRLFRQGMATLRELGEAGERLSHLSPPAGSGTAGGALMEAAAGGSAPVATRPVPGSAVFAPPERIRHDYSTSKLARQEARRARRIQRKTLRGQPQSLRDIDLA